MAGMLVLRLIHLEQARAPQQLGAPEWLAPGEQLRWQGFSNPERRGRFAAGRWLLRELLAQQRGGSVAGQPLDVDAQGRSQVGEAGLYANLSHSGAWLAAVLASAPVGVDLELIKPGRDLLSMAAMVHSAAQCRVLRGLDEAQRARQFHVWWCLKEAWLKARGLGLDYGLMRSLEEGMARPAGPAAWTHLDAQGMVLALAGPDMHATELHGLGGSGAWTCLALQGA